MYIKKYKQYYSNSSTKHALNFHLSRKKVFLIFHSHLHKNEHYGLHLNMHDISYQMKNKVVPWNITKDQGYENRMDYLLNNGQISTLSIKGLFEYHLLLKTENIIAK